MLVHESFDLNEPTHAPRASQRVARWRWSFVASFAVCVTGWRSAKQPCPHAAWLDSRDIRLGVALAWAPRAPAWSGRQSILAVHSDRPDPGQKWTSAPPN